MVQYDFSCPQILNNLYRNIFLVFSFESGLRLCEVRLMQILFLKRRHGAVSDQKLFLIWRRFQIFNYALSVSGCCMSSKNECKYVEQIDLY